MEQILLKNKVYEEKNEMLQDLLSQANERVSRRERGGGELRGGGGDLHSLCKLSVWSKLLC